VFNDFIASWFNWQFISYDERDLSCFVIDNYIQNCFSKGTDLLITALTAGLAAI
jgi:hypothetical protein